MSHRRSLAASILPFFAVLLSCGSSAPQPSLWMDGGPPSDGIVQSGFVVPAAAWRRNRTGLSPRDLGQGDGGRGRGSRVGGMSGVHETSAREAIEALRGHEAWAIIRRSTRAGD